MKRLIKQIEASRWQWEGAVPNLWDLIQNGEWTVLSASANIITAISNTQYIDLAGMSQREKTLFLKGLRIDYQNVPTMVDAVAGDAVSIVTMVSDVPVEATDFISPGFAYSTMNAENCALYQQDVWTATTDTAAWSSYLQNTATIQNGMMEATASDRIYFSAYVSISTRKIGATTSTLSSVVVPGLRVVLDVEAKEEQDYRYLMRLRRSYELAQGD